MENWRLEMNNLYRRFHEKSSYDVKDFILTLEAISKKYIESGEMNEGNSYIFPLTDGVHYAVSFYKNTVKVSAINISNPEAFEVILSQEDSIEKEYLPLIGVTKYMKTNGTFIGEKYPLSVYDMLKKIEKGNIITFTDGHTYVCVENTRNFIRLTDIAAGDFEYFTSDSIAHRTTEQIDYANNYKIQELYNKNSKHLTERMEYCYSTIDDALLAIENIEKTLSHKETKTYNIGKMSLTVSLSNKKIPIWCDKNGNKISKSVLVLVFGLLNNNIHKRKYVRTSFDSHTELALDSEFENKMEILASQKDFHKMYDELIEYVKKSRKSLKISTKYYDKRNDYRATKIIICEYKDTVNAYKLTYKDNIFKNEADSIAILSDEEFCAEYETLYSPTHQLLLTRTEY